MTSQDSSGWKLELPFLFQGSASLFLMFHILKISQSELLTVSLYMLVFSV